MSKEVDVQGMVVFGNNNNDDVDVNDDVVVDYW